MPDLHEKQTLAFESKAKEILYGGAAGGGKSHLMRVALIYYCLRINGLQCYLFRRLSNDLYKNHMEGAGGFYSLLSDFFDSGHVKYNGSKNCLSFSNGSKIWLSHCQYEKDRFSYQGAEMHILMIDELTHFTEVIYRFFRSRLRVGELDIPEDLKDKIPFIFCGSNPGGIGHNWVKSFFIDSAPPLDLHKVDKSEGGMLRQFIPAKTSDNPSLDEDYKDKLSGLGAKWLVEAMLNGDWNIVAGGMFDDVWDAKYNVVEPFKIPSSWLVDRSFDWGSSKPFSVSWWAESDGSDYISNKGKSMPTIKGDVFRIGELYGSTGKANEGVRWSAKKIAQKVLEIEKDNSISWGEVEAGEADSAIYTNQNENCIADDMEEEGVSWTKANKSPGSRKNGWQKMRDMIESAKDLENSSLYIFKTGINFIRTIPTLPRCPRDPDDVETNSEDHIADEVRYRLNRNNEKLVTKLEIRI